MPPLSNKLDRSIYSHCMHARYTKHGRCISIYTLTKVVEKALCHVARSERVGVVEGACNIKRCADDMCFGSVETERVSNQIDRCL